MIGDLSTSADIAVSGMKAQAQRLKVISENMANAESVSAEPGKDPYRRQVVTFSSMLTGKPGRIWLKSAKLLKTSLSLSRNMIPTIRRPMRRVMFQCRTLIR